MHKALFRSIAAGAIGLGLFAAQPSALAQNTLIEKTTVDAAASKADQERQIVAIIEDAYGRNAVVNTGSGLPPEIDDRIYAGGTLPTEAQARPLPDKIAGKLPQVTPGARWVGVGKHLVELGSADRIETVIYYALP
ncbi:hypothetical protein H0I76_14265 [Limibaculum sp. M0105]|uniref:Uncharacterized protein n=1 Tax=Thermohalobaculum xanthum TaxID=2753746 RepID=A0A8J7M870_9RHOB|nr:hypothetical protein [Thermohalobaculum xanthum]MBK0400361.1 hypothetical protein [Thermohalobaculum xanthum]